MKAVQKKRPELSVLGVTPATAVISQCCSYHARPGLPLTGTVFHTKRGNNCVFDILLDFSRVICPRVMIYISF